MRAIIKCTTSIKQEELAKVMQEHGWWPRLDQEHDLIKERTEDILGHVANDDLTLVKATLLFAIYDEETKTWGIVNNPSDNVITFRLKNSISERLKAACDKLVGHIQFLHSNNPGHLFRFSPRIDVLEPNSDNHAFSGEVLPPRRLLLAITERKTEALVGLFAFFVAVCLLIVTSPVVSEHILPAADSKWRQWIAGNLERSTTAALITGTLLWFEVLLHWFDIKRRSIIRWSFD
jgi:hypothetical protein